MKAEKKRTIKKKQTIDKLNNSKSDNNKRSMAEIKLKKKRKREVV